MAKRFEFLFRSLAAIVTRSRGTEWVWADGLPLDRRKFPSRSITIRRAPAAVLFFIIVGLPVAAGAQPWSVDKAQRIDQLVQRFRELKSDGDATLLTLSLSIGVDGTLTMAKGYGASDGRNATEHTLYDIGSVTKQFTAAAILELIHNGATAVRTQAKISMNTKLADVFGNSSYWAAQPWLTVGRLLSMTSNLPNFTRWPPSDTNPWEPISAQHLFDTIEQLTPPAAPSDDFEYSNTNYFLLAEMMEQVLTPGEQTPEPYHEFLRKRIFQPAGMLSTSFIGDKDGDSDPPDPFAPLARSQPVSATLDDQGAVLASPDYRHRRRPPFTHPDWLKGSGDVVSSALDLFAWNRALMSSTIVPSEVRDQMFADTSRVSPLIYYCRGWFCEHKEDRDVYSHSGAVPGYTSYNIIIRLKDGGKWICISLLSNCDQLDGLDDLAEDMADIVLE